MSKINNTNLTKIHTCDLPMRKFKNLIITNNIYHTHYKESTFQNKNKYVVNVSFAFRKTNKTTKFLTKGPICPQPQTYQIETLSSNG